MRPLHALTVAALLAPQVASSSPRADAEAASDASKEAREIQQSYLECLGRSALVSLDTPKLLQSLLEVCQRDRASALVALVETVVRSQGGSMSPEETLRWAQDTAQALDTELVEGDPRFHEKIVEAGNRLSPSRSEAGAQTAPESTKGRPVVPRQPLGERRL